MTPANTDRTNLLYRYVAPRWRIALGLAIVLLLSIALQLVSPQIIRGFIDAAQAQAEPDRLLENALAFLGVGLAIKLLRLATTYLSTDLGYRSTNALRSDLAAHCLSLDMPFHRDHSPGEMIERIDGDVTALANFFTQFIMRILGNSLLVLGIVALLFREDWRIGLIMAAFVAWAMVSMLRHSNTAVAYSAAERQASADMYSFVEERLEGLDDIRANASSHWVLWRFGHILRNLYRAATRAWDRRLVVIRIAAAMWGLGQVLALALGIAFFTRGILTIGAVYLLLHYTTMLLEPLEQIADQIQDLQKAGAGAERVAELFAMRSQIHGEGLHALPSGALAVTFEGVSFDYQAGEPVLNDISLHLEAGATLGLLGRTGSGKTTLTRLLFRLYDPQSGTIRIGGADLRALEPDHVRRRIGMVTQDVQLFRASVRDNLTFFDARVPDEAILGAIKAAGLEDWFARLPRGLDTELTPDESGLSAGQAQLLAFARVFLSDPAIVILDEPSARLDPVSERLMDRAIDQLLQGRTGIIIAHRLATVGRVDEIAVLEDGRLLEYGNRLDLASDPDSHLSRLLNADIGETLA